MLVYRIPDWPRHRIAALTVAGPLVVRMLNGDQVEVKWPKTLRHPTIDVRQLASSQHKSVLGKADSYTLKVADSDRILNEIDGEAERGLLDGSISRDLIAIFGM
jgi:hypothetical protein